VQISPLPLLGHSLTCSSRWLALGSVLIDELEFVGKLGEFVERAPG
jgi:hypothetical protein